MMVTRVSHKKKTLIKIKKTQYLSFDQKPKIKRIYKHHTNTYLKFEKEATFKRK